MSLLDQNWFQVAKQKPLLFGWLLDGAVVDYDDRTDMDSAQRITKFLESKIGSEEFMANLILSNVQDENQDLAFGLDLPQMLFNELINPKTETLQKAYQQNPHMARLIKQNKTDIRDTINQAFTELQDEDDV